MNASILEQPELAAIRTEARKILERRIDGLPDAFRTAFVLRALEEMDVEEVAACLAYRRSPCAPAFGVIVLFVQNLAVGRWRRLKAETLPIVLEQELLRLQLCGQLRALGGQRR